MEKEPVIVHVCSAVVMAPPEAASDEDKLEPEPQKETTGGIQNLRRASCVKGTQSWEHWMVGI